MRLSVCRVQFKGFLSAASSACCPRLAALTRSGGAHAVNERARPCVYETELLRTPAAPDFWPLSDAISKSPENLETDFKDDVNGQRHTSETREKL